MINNTDKNLFLLTHTKNISMLKKIWVEWLIKNTYFIKILIDN